MRTMSGGLCLHYDCSNRNSFGYCKTTVCINEHYHREQWDLPSTTNKVESVVIKQQTNGDRVRAMTDEELATLIGEACPPNHKNCREYYLKDNGSGCAGCWLDWLKKEADNG